MLSPVLTGQLRSNVSGGNITLNSDVIAASENSDISANSDNFFGGKVRINTQGIFGTQYRLAPTSNSDITATGGRPEFSGNVQINTPDVDPTSALVFTDFLPSFTSAWDYKSQAHSTSPL